MCISALCEGINAHISSGSNPEPPIVDLSRIQYVNIYQSIERNTYYMNQWRGWMLYCSCRAGVIYILIPLYNHTNVFLVSLHEFRTENAANGHSGLA
jgi:hypothetical protein